MSQKESAVEGPSTSTRVQPKRGQSSQSHGQDLMQMISEALAPIRKNLAKLPTKQAIDALLNDLVDRLERKIEEKVEERASAIESRINQLEQKVDALESALVVVDHLHRKIDDNEQYSRRVCLRFDNVPLPENGHKEDCAKKIGEIMNQMNYGLDVNDIDRAHRIGQRKTSEDGSQRQQIIARFKSFRGRTLVYRNRKKAKDNVKIRVDLTSKRMKILNAAMDIAKQSPIIDFVFADINCNVAAKLTNGNFLYFQSIAELQEKLAKQEEQVEQSEQAEEV